MKIQFFTLIILFALTACKSDQVGGDSNFQSLEKAAAGEASTENVNALIRGYVDAVKADPTPSKKNEEILDKAYKAAMQYNRNSDALGILQTLALDYYESAQTAERFLAMNSIFEKLGQGRTNDVFRKALKETYPNNQEIQRLKLDNSKINLDTMIASMALQMFNDSLATLNEPVARNYVNACEAFALVKQNDPSSPDYLHKAAETARTLRTIPKALSLYDWIIKKYPEHPRASQSLFLKAFTFDNNLKDYDNARKYYEEFLQQYPDNEFAESATFLLTNLGKSDEELLKALQSNKN